MSIVETMAKFVVGLKYENLPEEVIHQAKRILLDTLGCIIGGYETSLGRKFVDIIKDQNFVGKTTLIGCKEKQHWLFSIMGNSYLAVVLDFEQTLTGHESSTVVPSALAAAEETNASGKDVITAIVAGYEILSRVGLAIAPSRKRFKEVASPSIEVDHTFGATVAAGKIFGLDKEQMKNAISMAGVFTPIPTTYKFLERPASLLKGGHWWCAYGGAFAALLAREGVYGPADIFEGEHGYWICAGSDQCNFELFTVDLGKRYIILEDSFKPYPACRWTHCALDAISKILSKVKLHPEDISEIRVRTSSVIKDFCLDDQKPVSMVDAEFSIPYGIAMLVYGKKPGLEWYLEEYWKDPKIQEFMKKVKVETDEELDKLYFESKTQRSNPAIIEIVTKDGKVYSERVLCPKGDPDNPLSDEELESKFLSLVSPCFGEEKARELAEHIWNLEKIKDISELMEIIREEY